MPKLVALAANDTKLADKAKNNATKITAYQAKASAASFFSSAAAASSTSRSRAGMFNAQCKLLAMISMAGAGILMF